jgi:hypothetical protein
MVDDQVSSKFTKKKIRKFLGPMLALVGLLYTYRSHLHACPREVIFMAWSLLPPVWLILENWLLFDVNEESLSDFEVFKHSQSLARNLWGGFLIFLAVYYMGGLKG